MPNPFQNIRFHRANGSLTELTAIQPVRSANSTDPIPTTDEEAARQYLSRIAKSDTRPTVRSQGNSEQMPDLQLVSVDDSPLTETRLVRFEQAQSSIPVWGSYAIVEIEKNRAFVSADAELADFSAVSHVPSITKEEAIKSIEASTGKHIPADYLPNPKLMYFYDEEKDTSHLVYYFEKVPLAPKTTNSTKRGHGASPRKAYAKFDYLVDAHDGTLVYYYSTTPTLTKCTGLDALGASQVFYGTLIESPTRQFELTDSLRKLKTFDLGLKDVATPSGNPTKLPSNPIRNDKSKFEDKAAVSAHVNAGRVHDFFKSVLQRDGIDGKGMDLISVINCTDRSSGDHPPNWNNACWWEGVMWYGQTQDGDGNLISFARYLDIIAHELTHGITEHSSALVYRNQSGALNESFSDIFGVIVNNWYTVGPDKTVEKWNWEIGPGLGDNGLPLRDMSKPSRTNDPEHMNDFLVTTDDDGGVHTNSNIHNKAAYLLLTKKDDTNQFVFPAKEVAVLYYLCLTRLNKTANFKKSLRTLQDIADTFYAGDDTERKRKRQAITDAFSDVGISL